MLIQFFAFFYSKTGWRLAASIALQVVLGLVQGVGLLMIVPLLYIAGVIDGGAPTGLVKRLVDGFNKLGWELTLPWILVAFVSVVSLVALLQWVQMMLDSAICESFLRGLRSSIYEKMARARWLFLVRSRSSDFAHTLTEDLARVGQLAHLVLGLIGALAVLTSNVAAAVALSPVLAAPALVFGFLVRFAMSPLNRKAAALGQSNWRLRNELFGSVVENLGAFKLIKSFGRESSFVDRFRERSQAFEREAKDFAHARGGARFAYECLAALGLAAFVYAALVWVELLPASLLVMVLIFARLVPRMSSTQRQWHQIVYALPSYASYRSLEAQLDVEREELMREGDERLAFEDKVSFAGVCFQYEEARGATLRDVSMEILANRTTVIVGPSGSGKSTCVDLLLGLLRPDAGSIRVDDAELDASNIAAWRRQVAYVPQDSFLFHDTLRANLDWVGSGVDETSLWEALEMASAADFVRTLPEGLETVVGDRGARLSGGERQRIALARALLRRPRLLALDEATSNLDLESERRIWEALERLRGTMAILVISHRPESLTRADHVIRLDQGEVAQSEAPVG